MIRLHGLKLLLAALALTVSLAFVGGAATPAAAQSTIDVPLEDPAKERRAKAIFKLLRCLVCQNQSIDDSNAGLAKDLRLLVRERLVAGDSDLQVRDYVVARYGDYVLLKPPFKPSTYALWLGPGLMLLLAGAGVVVFLRRQSRRPPTAEAPLDDDERRRLAAMLDDA